jgi:hypothetical protein
MKHLLILATLLCLLMASTGCVSRAINEGVEKALGPTAYVLPMDPKTPEKDSEFLASYKNFQLVEPVGNDFRGTPTEFTTYFPGKFHEQLLSKGLPTGGAGKTLLIKVDILAYQAVSSYHKALGPTEEVVARVEFTDKDSGKTIGKAICIGRTYQSIGLGPKWKAWGLSRAIVNKWIDPLYPKEGRNETEETPPPSEGKSAE